MPPGFPQNSPVKTSEAVAVATLLFSLARGQAFHASLREQFRSRLPALGLADLQVKPHTLAPDPVHASTFYVVVTNPLGEAWLLHMAPASAPESSLFAKPALIARVRTADASELVLNAIPVATHLPAIVAGLLPQLLARSTKLHHLWSASAESDTSAIEEFLRRVPRRPNLLPALRVSRSTWDPYLPLVLAGMPEGFVFLWEGLRQAPAREDAAPFSRFSFTLDSLADARAWAAEIQLLRSRAARSVDVELDCSALRPANGETITRFLNDLKLLGAGVQSVQLPPTLEPSGFGTPDWGFTVPCTEPEAISVPGRVHWKITARAT